jgi:hypothetical protein
MLTRHRGGALELASNLDVHDTMTGVGLVDLVASMPAERRNPPELCTTSVHGGGRIDRKYATPGVQDTVVQHIQAQTDGSDHHALLTVISLALASALIPCEPVP